MNKVLHANLNMILTWVIVVSLVQITVAQKQNDNWYFGFGAALNFNSGNPTVLTNSSMFTVAGCSSISDEYGNLLFYTNGKRVWNKNHALMSNGSGLIADTISNNSALIAQKPGSDSLFYVFTVNSSNSSIYYSIIDMSLNSGLGDVTTVKNVLLYNSSDGLLIGTDHGSCSQIWIITRRINTNEFRAYSVTSAGVSSTAVTSSVGSNSLGYNVIGRVSPNGKKIAVAIRTNSPSFGYGNFEVFNFNNLTGTIASPISISNIRGPTSVEFSPNNNVLYGVSPGFLEDHLYQWDISTLTQSAVINSQILIDSTFNRNHRDIQLGPDGRIYVLISGSSSTSTYVDSLGVINSPNTLGSNCNFITNGLYLEGRTGGNSFPRMIASKPQYINLIDSCEGDSASFSLIDPGMFSAYAWNFGDSSSGSNNFSSLASPKHKFTGSGYYPIRFIGVNDCFQLDTLLDTIYIEPLPRYDIGNDTSICNGDTILLDASFAQSTYIWQDSTTDSTFNAYLDTIHFVEVTNGCGSVMDTILIDYRNFDDTNLGNDTSVCPGDSLLLDATTLFATHYLWQNNSTDSTYLVTMQGTYSVEVGNGCDTLNDSIDVFYINPPAINLGNDTSRCSLDSITLSGKLPAVNYLWYNGDTTQTITTTDTGLIWVEASNFRCSARDSIYISIYDSLFVNLGEDTTLCLGQTLTLDVTQNVLHLVNYLWQDSSTAPTISISNTGLYSVTVSDYCMELNDTINVLFLDVPFVNLGADTTICFGEDLVLDAGTDGTTYLWHDNTTDQTNMVNSNGKYWVRVENICGITSDSIVVSIRHAPNVFLGNDTTLCIDKTMTLDAYTEDADYLWQDGSTGRYYLVSQQGEYWVEVTNTCDIDNDSILALYIEKPFVDLGNDTTICLDQRLIFDVTTDQASYKWNDGSKDSIRVIRESGQYIVDVVNICGADQGDINVKVQDCNCRLFIPNSFTPNNDGNNDAFEIQSECNIIDFNVIILNRWGEIIFESHDIDFKWDGFYHNKEVPQENYVFSIQLTYRTGQNIGERKFTGRVMLMR